MGRSRTAGKRSGDPALYGKNIERRREGDDWNFKFRVGGVEYRGPCYSKDKREAERLAAQIKTEKKVETRQDREAGLGPMSFGAACDAWWEEEGCKNKETGLQFRLNRLRELIGEHKLLKDITPDDITRVKHIRAKDTRRAGKDEPGRQLSRPLTSAAVKATLVTLRTVINYAGMNKGAAVRMFDWTTWIKRDKEEFDVRVMTESEQALIWPELTDDVREVAEFNLGHPKRINELLDHRGRPGLTWPRVDLSGETIRLHLKGRDKPVIDPIAGDDVTRLQAIKARKLHPMSVFTYVSQRTRTYNGRDHVKGERRPMTYQHFYEVWTAACAKVGIIDLNPHCLRHTGATRFYWATRDINATSDLLNHKNLDTTKRYYLKTDPEVVRDAKRAMADQAATKVSAKVSARLLKIVG
jgi:integrase